MGATLQYPTVNVSTKVKLTQGDIEAQLIQQSNVQLVVGSVAGTLPVGDVDLVFTKSGTVEYGTPVAFTLSSILDPLGNTVAFARIVSIYIQNTGGVGGNAGYLLTMGNGTNPWTSDVATIEPQGEFLNYSPVGWGLASGSADTITLTAPSGATGANAVPYNIVVLGRST